MTSGYLAPAESSFSLIALGLLIGVVLAVIFVAVTLLLFAAYRLHLATSSTRDLTLRTLARNTSAINQLRGETSLALSRMDVDRMHEASQALFVTQRSLGAIVGRLSKILFTQPGMEGTVDQYGVTNSGVFPGSMAPGPLDVEAAQDAAQFEQWNARQHGDGGLGFDFSRPPASSAPQAVPGVPQQVTEAFLRYQAEQLAKADAESGSTDAIPVSTLPDLDDAHDLDAEQGADHSNLVAMRSPGFGDEPER